MGLWVVTMTTRVISILKQHRNINIPTVTQWFDEETTVSLEMISNGVVSTLLKLMLAKLLLRSCTISNQTMLLKVSCLGCDHGL